MPIHWTYDAFPPEADLLQGDIFAPTDAIRSILRDVHPHFLDPKYAGFLLLTQSCDLAVRKATCGTKYLTVAVIRPLEAVLHDLLSAVCRPVTSGIYLREAKGEARRLLERLFNQNEQNLGLFYLHPEGDAGIDIPSVALLRVAVTLRAEHYDVLRDARRGRLCSEFRSKLGWLVGNLYSRVGTQDWSAPADRKNQLEKLIGQCLDSGEAAENPKWVPQAYVDAAGKAGVRLDQIDREKVSAILEEHKPPSTKAQVIEHVLRVIKNVVPALDSETLNRMSNHLSNDSLFSKAVRTRQSE